MTDPIETTTQAVGGVAGASVLAGLAIKLWSAIFGTRAERAAARKADQEAHERAAELALKMVERANEDTQRHQLNGYRISAERDAVAHERDAVAHERDSCQEQLRKITERVAKLERFELDHRGCPGREAYDDLQGQCSRQENDLEWMGRAIEALSEGRQPPPRIGSTPPPGRMPPIADVRAEVARQETPDHG